MIRAQHPGEPPADADHGHRRAKRHLLDAGALYAGQTVARIRDIRPAGELVAALTP